MTISKEENASRGGRKAIVALAVLALLLGSGVVYFAESSGLKASTQSTTISSLQSSVSSLQNENQALQAQVAALSSSSASNGSASPGINAERIATPLTTRAW